MKTEMLHWLRDQLAKAEKSVRAREQAEASWKSGTTESWREAGCRLTKSQRLEVSAKEGRIAEKCRHDVAMIKELIAELEARPMSDQARDAAWAEQTEAL